MNWREHEACDVLGITSKAAKSIEADWRNSLPKTKDLIDIFDTGKKRGVYKWLLQDLTDYLAELNQERIATIGAKVNNNDGWVMEAKIDWLDQKIKETKSFIKRYEIKKEILKGNKDVSGKPLFKDIPLEEIKAVRIEDEIGVQPDREDSRIKWYKCPLHSEKTASFTLYKESNSFYCNGCGKGGTVIDFIMHLYKYSVSEAIKYLTSRV